MCIRDRYYDIAQQGEGIADVTTHLIDLINWQCFPVEAIHYQSDVKVLSAKHWPTPITLAEFSQSTQTDSFPIYPVSYTHLFIKGRSNRQPRRHRRKPEGDNEVSEPNKEKSCRKRL